MASVYVSSPLGFSAFGRRALEDLYERIRQSGLTVRDPWQWPGQREAQDSIRTADLLAIAGYAGNRRDWDVSHEIAARNVTELLAADVVLAVLDGVDVDSGVAAEVGYASAYRRPVVGLRTDERNNSDGDGYMVNLQVTHLIVNSNPPRSRIVTDVDDALAALNEIASG